MQSESATDPSGSALQANNENDETTNLEEEEELQENEKEPTERDGPAPNKFSISIDVGDVSPEEVTVKVREGTLSISGQHMENKGKGFSFHGFNEEYTIPPTVDSRTLVATILDRKTMKIEGYHHATPTNNTLQINSTEIVADSKTTQQSRKRSFQISERSSFSSSHDVTTLPRPGPRKSCTILSDCAHDESCTSNVCCRTQGIPVHYSSKAHSNVTKPSSDKHIGVPTPSKKRKTVKMPPPSSSRSTTPGVRPKTNRSSTPKPHINPTTPPPSRTKHSVVSPTPMERTPNLWTAWGKSDFEPLTPPSASDINKPPPPQ